MKFLTILNLVLLLTSACQAGNGWSDFLHFDASLPKGVKPGLGISELKDMLRASKLGSVRQVSHILFQRR